MSCLGVVVSLLGTYFPRVRSRLTFWGNGRFEGLIYAPNAPVSFLAGRHMTGAIIGSRVVVDWNSIITFDNINASASFPDDIFGGTSGDGAGSSAFSRGRWSDAK